MKEKLIHIIAKSLGLAEKQVLNTIDLLEDGATIPFISRYRKEKTGSLDETQILEIQKEYKRLGELEDRRFSIIETIEEQDKLTEELEKRLLEATTMAEGAIPKLLVRRILASWEFLAFSLIFLLAAIFGAVAISLGLSLLYR